LSDPHRAVIFANGELEKHTPVQELIRPGDTIIAADGGSRYCALLGITPDVLIGDFDSITQEELDGFQKAGAQIVRHPARKDFTDLELALHHARALEADEILVLGALGARWDQTIANLLLPASARLRDVPVRLIDGRQEVRLLRGGETHEIRGSPGDIVSLIPLGESVDGITTKGLEYPLRDETLYFGATRGISNVLLGDTASIMSRQGNLLCVVIHGDPSVSSEDA
jgi:thiamine pyrophosphokinase